MDQGKVLLTFAAVFCARCWRRLAARRLEWAKARASPGRTPSPTR